MKLLNALRISNKEVLPLVEGGKGIAATNGFCSGAWAAAGGVGTFSAVNADSYDNEGRIISPIYYGRTRQDRQNELISKAIKGGITQAQIAHECSNGQGRIHMNVLWEMGGVEPILHGILSQCSQLIHGITCGAGLPYKLAEICAQYNVFYYPIVSSARAFRVLWKRSYERFSQWLGGVVYEDPWLAGGHNGLSNTEDPLQPEPPYARVLELRQVMRDYGLVAIPIIMAGGVWCLSEWQDWIDNPNLGAIGFQFGTRPLLTQESPIPRAWKEKLLSLKPGDICLNSFSPTGFYSSAVRNSFLRDLEERSQRQIPYTLEPQEEHATPLSIGALGRIVYVQPEHKAFAMDWIQQGFTRALRTPDQTLVFVTPETERQLLEDQTRCMGCLSACRFSNWSQNAEGTTGRKPDPRSYCIQRTLQAVVHTDDIENQLMFAGHHCRFGSDPFYANGFIPTVKELVAGIQIGS